MFKSRTAVVLFTGMVWLSGAPALLAEPKGKDEHPQQMNSPQAGKNGQGQQGGKPSNGGQSYHDGHGDFHVDSDRIRVTIGDNRSYWSPGPALPPGIRKNLQRGKPLPPGIAKQQLDSRLVSRLPYYEGHEWLQVGTDLVQVSISTGLVNEVLNDMFH
jgi:Ni/Co efflux regulator RcnB